jgi:hypothetical protein
MAPVATARRAATTAPARTTRARPARRAAPRRSSSRPAATRTAPKVRGAASVPMPARLVPLAVGRTATAVSGLAESGLAYRLTRGRLWIGALTTLLVGIVALNVLSLSFNASTSKVGRQTDALKREISILRAQIANAGASNVRVQAEAARLGLIAPEPGSITYLKPTARDAAVAAKRLASGELTGGGTSTVSTPTAVTLAPPTGMAPTTPPPSGVPTPPAGPP